MESVTKISTLVAEQFPAFYKEDGPNFIQFVKAYYQWMEEDGNFLDKAYHLPEYLDIDKTLDEYISHFKNTYMAGLPQEILGNPRYLQKHILDLYRSKGSPESVRLLFRLLYNEDIEIYVPSFDIFRLSDGNWIRRSYIEITQGNCRLDEFQDQEIIGTVSGARAYVSTAEMRMFDQKQIWILFIENIRGQFLAFEPVIYEGLSPFNAPTVAGSVVNVERVSSEPGFSIGETLVPVQDEDRGLRLRVKDLRPFGDSIIVPTVLDGGFGFSLQSEVTVSAGSNTVGSGADFRVGSLLNTSFIDITEHIIEDVESLTISNADYGFIDSESTDMSSEIGYALSTEQLEIGTIDEMFVINPGNGYDGSVEIEVYEVHTARLVIPDGNGGFWGEDAVIDGSAAYGNNMVGNVEVVSSGVNYYTDNEPVLFKSVDNDSRTYIGRIRLGGTGREQGFYQGTNGFASSNKYLQDSHYYQEFSYEIRSSRSLDHYAKIVRNVVHPAGNELFGRPVVRRNIPVYAQITATVTTANT